MSENEENLRPFPIEPFFIINSCPHPFWSIIPLVFECHRRIFMFVVFCFLLCFPPSYNGYGPMNFSAHVFLCYALWLMVLQAISSEENIYKKNKHPKKRITSIKTYLRGTVSLAWFCMKHLPIYIWSLLGLCSLSLSWEFFLSRAYISDVCMCKLGIRPTRVCCVCGENAERNK